MSLMRFLSRRCPCIVTRDQGDANGFTLTPDGEECFGTPVDAAFLASLIDYHNVPIEVQIGLDQAMGAERQKYTE